MVSQRTWDKWRPFLWPVALLYLGLSWWRNFFYKLGFFISKSVNVPVISIGNIAVGGTGKTPMTIHIAGLLLAKGFRVGIVSRGYGRNTTGTVLVSDLSGQQASVMEAGDEPFLMASKLDGVPVMVDEDRFRGANAILQQFDLDVLILDDAFQHRGLARDCDIVLLDATTDEKLYKIFPVGILRERFSGLTRAKIAVWTRTNFSNPPHKLVDKITDMQVPQLWATMTFTDHLVRVGSGDTVSNDALKGHQLLAFCGVAKPITFYSALMNLGLEPTAVRYFRDHHDYSAVDLAKLGSLADNANMVMITTEKDAVKLPEEFVKNYEVYCLPVGVAFSDEDASAFEEILMRCLTVPQHRAMHGQA